MNAIVFASPSYAIYGRKIRIFFTSRSRPPASLLGLFGRRSVAELIFSLVKTATLASNDDKWRMQYWQSDRCNLQLQCQLSSPATFVAKCVLRSVYAFCSLLLARIASGLRHGNCQLYVLGRWKRRFAKNGFSSRNRLSQSATQGTANCYNARVSDHSSPDDGEEGKLLHLASNPLT